ncbi:hypothetical protein N9Z64_02690 [bacterium]|nr:hypothetical protein [bacterium]
MGITLPTPINKIGNANIKIFANGAQTTKLPEIFKASFVGQFFDAQFLKTQCESIFNRICLHEDRLVYFPASLFPSACPSPTMSPAWHWQSALSLDGAVTIFFHLGQAA